MGILKRSTMTLLTTLAALIIIVNCVEEDLDSDYQHELRPRILDTRKSTYDESWRTREATSMLQRPRNSDDWKEASPDEPLKHQRPGRKRKRRPQTPAVEELVPQEEISYPDEPLRPYHDFESEKYRDLTERPKMRRKKPEERPIRWSDDDVTALERPLRRKPGPRKNRPSFHSSPDVNRFQQVADINQDVPEVKIEHQDKVRTDSDQVPNHENIFENKPEGTDEITRDIKSENSFELKLPISERVNFEQISRPQMTEDKSLSEFSMEAINKPAASKPKFKFPRRHKIINPSVQQEHDKGQETVDPLTLKDILKRSNGSSLSEILQQHNLSLTDLLHGKEQAVSIFKNQEFTEDKKKYPSEPTHTLPDKHIETKTDVKDESEELGLKKSETKYVTESVTEAVTEYLITTEAALAENLNEKEIDADPTTDKPLAENTTKIRRRFPLGLRKKLRMKPMLNVSTTQKAQLSRDLLSLNNRKYTQLRRNTTKSKEWKDVISNKRQNNIQEDNTNTTIGRETTTQLITSEDTTVAAELDNKMTSLEEIPPQASINLNLADIDMDVTEVTSPVTEITTEIPKNITDKSYGIVTMTRPTAVSIGLRRTALNNRLKRKRIKQKNTITESPQDDLLKHLYGMDNLVSSSEFIAKTQQPSTTLEDSKYFTTLQDFMTTESVKTTINEVTQTETIFTTEMIPNTTIKTTTQEPAKIEIEEILNDTQILSKLSKILMARNMTLEELIAHRERGSSRIHLADVFHNNSRESNPPEPFLTKSILEPMSKETYPLRVLLDANLHDPNGKVTSIDPELGKNINIPIVMDFGNNVNENAENMGIMSLFNNYTKNITKIILPSATNDTNEKALDIIPNVTSTIVTDRESRALENNDDDVVNWNEILSLISTPKTNESEEIILESPFKKITLEDINEDGLMALEDLQRLKDLDNPMGSELNGNIELNFANTDLEPQGKGFLDNVPSQTTSVTVATASIVGLGMILFLLTYIAFKWRQQRSTTMKKPSFCEDRIATPVFETRKGHKNNSSIRSISPIIQTSNIYAVNTLDSHNCEESGEYIWDSMRQPYQ